MESFFERVGRFWPAGRRDLHWHILPSPDEASALATPFTGFAPPGLNTVPVRRIHCTLVHYVGLGITGIDTADLLEDVRAYARTVQPFSMTFDRPAVGTVAVEVSGWPGRVFTEIVDTLTQAAVRTGASFTAAPSRYPHISVAYTADGAEDISAVTLKAALADIEHPVSTTVVADRLHLVEQWHDGAHITWNPIAEVSLAGVAA